MNSNFALLKERVLDTLCKSDLEYIYKQLSTLKEATLCVGVGGSKVVSCFASKVLERKNNCVVTAMGPRDLLYKNFNGYKNVLVCSYSGSNYGVDVALMSGLKSYILSNSDSFSKSLMYKSTISKEKSFISLAATLMPISVMLSYYLDGDISFVEEILKDDCVFELDNVNIYEILSGYETKSAEMFFESTLVESGIGVPIVHDKYDYCHGRSTITYSSDSLVILFDRNKELDKLVYRELVDSGKKVIVFNSCYEDDIVDDFYFTYKSMLLCRDIALLKHKNLSNVDYSPLVKKLYYFKGEM